MPDPFRKSRPTPGDEDPSLPARKRGRRLITRRARASTILLGILTTILVGWVLHVGASILQPLVIAFLLASMLQPVVRGLARWHIPPPLTVIVVVVLFFFGVWNLGLILNASVRNFLRDRTVATAPVVPARSASPPAEAAATGNVEDVELVAPGEPTVGDASDVSSETGDVATTGGSEALADGLEGAEVDVATLQEPEPPESKFNLGQADPFSPEQAELMREYDLDSIVAQIVAQLREASFPEPLVDFLEDTLSGDELRGLAAGLIGGGFDFTKGLVLVVIYMLFIFAEQAVFRRKLLAIAGDRASDVVDTISRGIQRYLGVKTLISLVTGSVAYAVLVALDVPYALLWGLLTFLLNYIPTFGSIIAAVFPTASALAANDTWNKALIVIVAYLAINMTLGNFVEPKILGRELNLSPLVIIISVVVWAGLWGPVGTFLAVPLTAGIQIVLASGKTTHPIAVMMSSGPPREPRRLRTRPQPHDDEGEAAA